MQTKDPRIQVTNFGPGNWRTVARDDCGDWAITGAPYATKTEALLQVDRLRVEFFGEED